MHLSIVAFDSRGDVQPYLALGMGLKSAGDQVQFCADQIFEPLVTATGLNCTPVTAAPVNMMQQILSRVGASLKLIGQTLQREHGVEKALSLIQAVLEKNRF